MYVRVETQAHTHTHTHTHTQIRSRDTGLRIQLCIAPKKYMADNFDELVRWDQARDCESLCN